MCRCSQALYSRKQRFVRSGRCKLLKQLSRDPEYLAHSRYRLNSSHFRKALCCCRARVSGTLSSSARCWSTTSDRKPYRMVLDTGSRRTLVGNPVVPASENADIGRPSRRGDRIDPATTGGGRDAARSRADGAATSEAGGGGMARRFRRCCRH